ncbi:FAD/FMN-containing dehydrogenase [Thermomonospora echinospora]|uniref:FAD/FMN-containing dehydrogenase n=2 Tax=Thermomonospora echinospora TaxID=1992 RepID=A0A1H6DYJ9_9ACTN|nr:FAD/FMN-containing dehydrogenase [Thermomonospora echinospora]
MSDYGHDLRFGAFLTPTAHDPERVVELAVLAEESGLDLVTFQDHPYQPGFLDTWTLLTWVAARTSRVEISGNVLNLPLRNPAVLARAAASLDLLSGGRAALGLGAGAFLPAIAAMGGPALTAGESVTALEEAVEIIRGVWRAGDRTPLRVRGKFHRVDGAKRGPAPAHDIPLWLGAYKPRMLRLVGAVADGWLPSLNYIDTPNLQESNAIIDQAAREAGRDPREIRRLLNILTSESLSTQEWVDRLVPLALQDGISTFLLGSDDPDAIASFGREVAPAVREAVDRERARVGTPTGLVRPAAALALRRTGIDYDAIPTSLQGRAVEPGDREYEDLRSTYIWEGRPGLILRPADEAQVTDALAFARRQDVPLAVRSGGHGLSGRATNDGGIVLDLSALDSVEVLDRERRLVRVGAGARWGDVAARLAPHGLAIGSGDYGDVGVGGLGTTAGLGLLARSYGLTIDHVKAATVVLADGRTVRADADHHPDLLWGLRGAGASLGAVTSLEIEAAEVSDVVFAVFLHDASDTAGFLQRWGELVEGSPRKLTAFLTLTRQGGALIAQTLVMWADADTDAAVTALEPFLDLAPVLSQQAQLTSYAQVMARAHNPHRGQGGGTGELRSRSALVPHLDDRTAKALAAMFDDGHTGLAQVRSMGGAVADTPADQTAFAHRDRAFALSATIRPRTGTRAAEAARAWDEVGDDAIYLSFETHDHEAVLTRAFPPATLERLRQVKRTYDPDNVFHGNFTVTPAA